MIFSIIIPTFNRRALLAKCLERVFDQSFSSTEYEVIVIVDGGGDDTAPFLHTLRPSCRFIVIEQPNEGPASARNAGVAAASGELLLFLDDDILCDSSLLSDHYSIHSSAARAVAHGPILVAPESPRTIIAECTRSWYVSRNERFDSPIALNVSLDGFLISNTSMPREVFLQSGGFDTRLPLLEDLELGLRLQKMDVSFIYQPRALVHEVFVKSTRAFLVEDGFAYGRASVMLCQKHPYYRRYSVLKNLGDGGLCKRISRRAAVSATLMCTLIFPSILGALERRSDRSWCLRIGTRLLAIGHRLRVLQGARRQAGSFEVLLRRFGVRLPILLYHNVSRDRLTSPRELTLSSGDFESQVRWLLRLGYTTITLHDWYRWVTEGIDLPVRPILLTFDDGYADLAREVFPALRKCGFCGSVFLVTSLVGKWNAWDVPSGASQLPLLNRTDIRAWAGQNIEFGAHGRFHVDLTKLTLGELTDEVLGSARELTELVGMPTTCFAYPFGKFDIGVQQLVERSFEIGVSTEEGINSLQTNLSALRRLYISGDGWTADFLLRIVLGWSPIVSVRARLRVRSRFRNLRRRFTALFVRMR